MKTLDPDYLAPKQECSDDFARDCVCAYAFVANKIRLEKREQKNKNAHNYIVPVRYKSGLYCYKSALYVTKVPYCYKVPYRELQKCPIDVTKVP